MTNPKVRELLERAATRAEEKIRASPEFQEVVAEVQRSLSQGTNPHGSPLVGLELEIEAPRQNLEDATSIPGVLRGEGR